MVGFIKKHWLKTLIILWAIYMGFRLLNEDVHTDVLTITFAVIVAFAGGYQWGRWEADSAAELEIDNKNLSIEELEGEIRALKDEVNELEEEIDFLKKEVDELGEEGE